MTCNWSYYLGISRFIGLCVSYRCFLIAFSLQILLWSWPNHSQESILAFFSDVTENTQILKWKQTQNWLLEQRHTKRAEKSEHIAALKFWLLCKCALEFLSFHTLLTFWTGWFVVWRLSYILQSVWQHPGLNPLDASNSPNPA